MFLRHKFLSAWLLAGVFAIAPQAGGGGVPSEDLCLGSPGREHGRQVVHGRVPRPERVASELARVVVTEGRTATTVWDAPERNRYLGVMFDAIGDAGATPPPELPPGPPIFRFADEGALARLLEDAGFSDVTVETIGFEERLSSAGELWEAIMGGAVRLPPLVLGQPEAVQREIRSRFEQLLEEHRVEHGFDVPVSVKLASGTKAGR